MNRSTEIGSSVVNVREGSKRQRDMEIYRMREESKKGEKGAKTRHAEI